MSRHASKLTALAAGVAIALASAASAQAAVISVFTNRALTATPFTFGLGGGVGSLSFIAADTAFGPGAAVATAGNALVTTIFGQVADYGTDTVFDGTAAFAAFSTPAVIQYSAANDFIGFTYQATDGQHLGYAEVFGSTLVGYAYESVAGANIVGANITGTAVPEPASAALVLAGVAGIGLVRRRKRAVAA